MYILANMWFSKLVRQFFFLIDKVVYNFISMLYDLLITIARTSVLTQADIADMADRVYKLLAIFMIFKVTLSLITYVVNPDDFTDKSKGVSKLTMNIILSLAMLILTPYIFSYAFQFQTIILEDNSLATLIFGQKGDEDFLTTAGDDMAFITMSPFFTPNVSIAELYDCTELTVINSDGTVSFNQECSGLSPDLDDLNDPNSLMGIVSDRFEKTWLENYVSGVEAESLALMFREDMALATDKGNDNWIIDYKYLFSTAVGIVVVLLLITFCMDVGLRSIKLSFLQLIAPIPILSYIDPKSGKDGLFKKWYEMCFKTYLSLFIRLLALYFAIYIISKVADLKMVDIVDGSYVTNGFVAIFIIIGALMFAKQLPKMLEGLGIKLDGGGKFTLNPFKKFEEEALGGKRVTGAAGGMVAGLIGNKGNPFSALAGAARGFAGGKGYKGGLAAQADVNRKMRDLRINGASRTGAMLGNLSSKYGLDDADIERKSVNLRKNKKNLTDAGVMVDEKVKTKQAEKKAIQEGMASSKRKISDHKRMQDAISSMEKRAKDEIELGHGGEIGKTYLTKKAQAEYYENNIGKKIDIDGKSVEITPEMAGAARQDASEYLTNQGMKAYMSQAGRGKFSDGGEDLTFQNYYKTYVDSSKVLGVEASEDGSEIHKQYGQSKGAVGDIEREIAPAERRVSTIDDEIRNIETTTYVKIDGEDVPYEKARAIIEKQEKELNEEKERRKRNREYAQTTAILNSKK